MSIENLADGHLPPICPHNQQSRARASTVRHCSRRQFRRQLAVRYSTLFQISVQSKQFCCRSVPNPDWQVRVQMEAHTAHVTPILPDEIRCVWELFRADCSVTIHMYSITLSPNCEHLISVAPSINRA